MNSNLAEERRKKLLEQRRRSREAFNRQNPSETNNSDENPFLKQNLSPPSQNNEENSQKLNKENENNKETDKLTNSQSKKSIFSEEEISQSPNISQNILQNNDSNIKTEREYINQLRKSIFSEIEISQAKNHLQNENLNQKQQEKVNQKSNSKKLFDDDEIEKAKKEYEENNRAKQKSEEIEEENEKIEKTKENQISNKSKVEQRNSSKKIFDDDEIEEAKPKESNFKNVFDMIDEINIQKRQQKQQQQIDLSSDEEEFIAFLNQKFPSISIDPNAMTHEHTMTQEERHKNIQKKDKKQKTVKNKKTSKTTNFILNFIFYLYVIIMTLLQVPYGFQIIFITNFLVFKVRKLYSIFQENTNQENQKYPGLIYGMFIIKVLKELLSDNYITIVVIFTTLFQNYFQDEINEIKYQIIGIISQTISLILKTILK